MWGSDGKSKILAAVGSMAVCLCAAELRAAQQTATWLGGTGSWLDPTKWSGGVVPSNSGSDTFNVVIDGNSSATSLVQFQNPPTLTSAIDSLTINAGDTLSLAGQNLSVNGPFTVDGTMIVGGNGQLNLGQALVGSGTVKLSGHPIIRAGSGATTIGVGLSVRLHESVTFFDIYFQGGTTIGVPMQPFINHGHIVSDRPGITELAVAGSSLSNLGTLEVRNGGYLVLDSNFTRADLGTLVEDGGGFVLPPMRTFNNAGNTLSLDSSQWVLQGTIKGGTLAGPARGLMVPYLDTGTLDGVTLDNAKIELTGSLRIVNGISGTGTIVYGNPEAIEGSGNLEIPVIPPGIKIDGSPVDAYLGGEFAQKGVVRLAENQGTIRVAKNLLFGNTPPGRTALEGASILNRGTFELSPDGTLGVQGPGFGAASLTFADGGKLVVDGGGLLKFAADLGTLNLSSSLDLLIVHAKPDGTPYDMTKIVDGQQTLGVFNSVTDGITVTYLAGDIFISGTPTPEPASLLIAALLSLASRRTRRRD